MGVYAYCSCYYTTEAFKETYAATVYPLGNPSTSELPDELQGLHVDPPSPKNPTGRPRTTRILSRGERVIKKKCSRCGRYGHNLQTYKFNFKGAWAILKMKTTKNDRTKDNWWFVFTVEFNIQIILNIELI